MEHSFKGNSFLPSTQQLNSSAVEWMAFESRMMRDFPAFMLSKTNIYGCVGLGHYLAPQGLSYMFVLTVEPKPRGAS